MAIPCFHGCKLQNTHHTIRLIATLCGTLIFLRLCAVVKCQDAIKEHLSKSIGYYEPVHYNRQHVTHQHDRVRRSAKPSEQLKLEFSAFKREFKLLLHPDGGSLASDVVVETSDGEISYDSSRAYIGHLMDEAESFVHGTISAHGHFEGKILLPNDLYSVERAARYFTAPAFHTVIYHHSAVYYNHTPSAACLADKLHTKRHDVNRTRNTTTTTTANVYAKNEDYNTIRLSQQQKPSYHESASSYPYQFNPDMSVSLHHLYKLSAGQGQGQGQGQSPNARVKRDTQGSYHELLGRYTIDQTKTTCLLYMQADHLFYEKHGKNVEAVIEVLTQHVQGVNAIYRTIDFDHDAQSDNINFIIKRIKVHTNPHAHGYKFQGNYGVEKYLELFSEANYDDFCLAYMFTYRDFEGGTLGLAWTGDLHNAGGVCEKNGFFRGSMKSLNSGIVTTLNYGKDVPTTVSHVTLAHEMGHNMGSQHDPDTDDCSPGGDGGNYIMFARATSGDRDNNNKFSRCSKESMSVVMAAKGRGVNGCFIIYTGAICGNEVVEPGEDCDCGWEDDCQESCCYPQRSHLKPGEKPCMYRTDRRVHCSPSAGPCCTSKCQLISPLENKICREETSCTGPATCDGYSASCPDARHKPNKTRCEDDYVCYQGECTGSICLVYGLESCQCAPSRRNDWSDQKLCHLCCKEPGPGKACRRVVTTKAPLSGAL